MDAPFNPTSELNRQKGRERGERRKKEEGHNCVSVEINNEDTPFTHYTLHYTVNGQMTHAHAHVQHKKAPALLLFPLLTHDSPAPEEAQGPAVE